MCGFLINFSLNKNININKTFQSAKLIGHRGPDDFHFYRDGNYFLGIFYRLSIQDLTTKGRQPMISKCKRYIIFFNGEIYNKEKLKKKIDVRLKGSSDTEVILNLFIKYKTKFVSYLEGMFSIIIYDNVKKNCYFFRDQFGIKPLYYLKNQNQIIVSSEIKPIINFKKSVSINQKSIIDFFFLQKMDYEDQTFFKDIKSLPPGRLMTFGKKTFIKSYWSLNKKKTKTNYISAKKDIKELYLKSVKKHLLSDVNVGLMISGGSDSSSLFNTMKNMLDYNINCFSYYFSKQKENSESISLKKLSIKNLNLIEIAPKDIINNFNEVIRTVESPLTSMRQIADFLTYRKASKTNKVILLGHGGDEIFGGYIQNIIRMIIQKGSINQKVNELINFFINKKKTFLDREKFLVDILMNLTNDNLSTKDCNHYFNVDLFNHDFLDNNISEKTFLDTRYNENFNLTQKSQAKDIFEVSLPRNLKYCDRLSMKNGIEARVPFLDTNFVEYGFNLKNDFKYRDNISRWIFKKINKEVKLHKLKESVPDPQKIWLTTHLNEFFLDTINSIYFKNLGIFNKKNVINEFNLLKKGKINNSFLIFQILSFVKFYNIFFRKN